MWYKEFRHADPEKPLYVPTDNELSVSEVFLTNDGVLAREGMHVYQYGGEWSERVVTGVVCEDDELYLLLDGCIPCDVQTFRKKYRSRQWAWGIPLLQKMGFWLSVGVAASVVLNLIIEWL